MPGGAANDHRFHRPPRAFPAAVPADEIVIATPPSVQRGVGQSWIYVLFPVVGSATLFAYAVIYDNPLFFYIAGILVAVTLGFAILLRWSQHRAGKLSARRQRRLYREHLAKREAQLRDVATLQSHGADRLYPDPPKLWSAVLRREGLWERRPGDDDFLTARLGRGPVAHAGRPRVELGANPLAEHEEQLVDEATALVDRWAVLPRQPVTVDLATHPVLSIVGPRDAGRAVARAIATQFAASRSPADVHLAAAFQTADADGWEWMKWLPHARPESAASADGPPRPLLARGHAGLAALLDEHVAPRVEHLRILDAARTSMAAPQVDAPVLVLVVDDYAPLDPRARLPLLREVLMHGQRLRVCVIVLVDDAASEPAEAAARVRLAERGAAALELAGPTGGAGAPVETDAVAVGAAEAIARALAPLRLVDDGTGGAGSRSRSLLELLGLPSAAAIDPATDWAARPRTLALRAPIGVTSEGQLVELDLKQAAEGGMGPHGLVIGATGSGKSELLRTLIAGLAINHSPEELAFVFVDFKGGAALAELAELPHTAGMITNLQRDHSLIDRMHDALRGEQERRQSILRDAGNLDDVLQYRRRRAEDPSMPALPDLVVLIDEFGELLAARPDFIDLFVAIGRVGRSLGIHLLFSSQRFEEGKLRGLESHLRYRICLRTYSAMESKGVLGTPDAALLPPEPGLGYLKVDTSIYERFRAALVSSPRDERPQAPGQRITTFAAAAEPRGDADASADLSETGASVATGMREVVTALRAAAEPVHQIWLPPLEPLLALGSVAPSPPGAAAPGLRATLGITDLPLEQRREPLELDFTGATGHLAIVGAPQSGKSTALRTLVLALAREHGPRAVQFAAIDLGGGTLRTLTGLPHLSAVAGKADRDLARLIISRMRAELRTREALFRRHGLDDIADARERRAQGAAPEDGGVADLFLLVDGWAQLRRDHPDLDLEIEELIGTGLSYGIHVVVTASRWAEMRPSVADGLAARLELRLNDPLESEIDRRANEALPADRPGRALTTAKVETQLALPRLDEVASAAALGEASAAAARQLAGRWAHEPLAPPMRALPPVLTAREIDGASPESGLAVALGIEEVQHAPVIVDLLGADPHFLILGDGESGRTNVLRAFALACASAPDRPRISIVDPRRTLADLATLPGVDTYVATPSRTAELAARLAVDANARLPQAGDDPLAAVAHASMPRDVVIVDDYDLLVGPEGNPLAALTGLIAHGRDAGLHLVVARRVAGTTRAAFEQFFQRLTELRTPGLMLSGEPAEGPLLDGHRARPFPPGRGLLVRRGQHATVVQTVLVDPPIETGPPPAAARTA